MVSEVSKLKQQMDGEIVVYASRQLVRTLMEHDLVDELRLIVFPVALGAGERLFGEASDKRPMRLVDTRTVGDGLAFLAYALDRKAYDQVTRPSPPPAPRPWSRPASRG